MVVCGWVGSLEFCVLVPGALPGSHIEYQQFYSDVVSREIESLRNNQKEIPEIKNAEKEMKNGFDDLISRVDMADEKKSLTVKETSKTEKQRENKGGK